MTSAKNVRLGLVLCWAASLVAVWSAETVIGQDFRVDSEVFLVGKEKEPIQETLTIFSKGKVYDFVLTEPREITIFNSQMGRFTLLDESRRVKSEISTQDLMNYVLDLHAEAARSENALFKFSASPAFEPSTEDIEENGQKLVRITLTGKPLIYSALGRNVERPQAALAYRFFADWYARLNATRPGNLPPEARLELNKALAERDLLPTEVTRTTFAANPLAKKVEVKSRHLVNWTLSGKDRERIEEAGTQMVNFQAISFKEYARQRINR